MTGETPFIGETLRDLLSSFFFGEDFFVDFGFATSIAGAESANVPIEKPKPRTYG